MNDTLICPGLYAYHFRIDILDNSNNRIITNGLMQFEQDPPVKYHVSVYTCRLKQFLKNQFMTYHLFLESGEKTNKCHIQGILWSVQHYSNPQINTLKAKYFRWHRQCKNSLSITQAKKIKNLASYSAKDKRVILSNLSPHQLSLIPTWQKKREIASNEFKLEVIRLVKQEVQNGSTASNTALAIIDFYWDNNKRQPARMDIIKYLGIYHPSYTSDDYLQSINIFPTSF